MTRQDSQSANFDTGKCLYYGRSDIRFSDHRYFILILSVSFLNEFYSNIKLCAASFSRPVSGLYEVEVNKTVPKKLIELLNRVLNSSHGSFQIVLIVTVHYNNNHHQMDDHMKNTIIKIFSQFSSFASARWLTLLLFVCYYLIYLDFWTENFVMSFTSPTTMQNTATKPIRS